MMVRCRHQSIMSVWIPARHTNAALELVELSADAHVELVDVCHFGGLIVARGAASSATTSTSNFAAMRDRRGLAVAAVALLSSTLCFAA